MKKSEILSELQSLYADAMLPDDEYRAKYPDAGDGDITAFRYGFMRGTIKHILSQNLVNASQASQDLVNVRQGLVNVRQGLVNDLVKN